MALVAGLVLRAVKPEGLGRVGIVGCVERLIQAVDRRCLEAGRKGRLSRRVRGDRVGREIVVEGDVLLEDHDQVLDRRDRAGVLAGRRVSPRSNSRTGHQCSGEKPEDGYTQVEARSHFLLPLPNNDPTGAWPAVSPGFRPRWLPLKPLCTGTDGKKQ